MNDRMLSSDAIGAKKAKQLSHFSVVDIRPSFC